MSGRTYVVDDAAVTAYIRSGISDPANLSAAADGLRTATLGWQYFERSDAVFWRELSDAERTPWIEQARASLEGLLS